MNPSPNAEQINGLWNLKPAGFGLRDDITFEVWRGGQRSKKTATFADAIEFLVGGCGINPADEGTLSAALAFGMPVHVDGADVRFVRLDAPGDLVAPRERSAAQWRGAAQGAMLALAGFSFIGIYTVFNAADRRPYLDFVIGWLVLCMIVQVVLSWRLSNKALRL